MYTVTVGRQPIVPNACGLTPESQLHICYTVAKWHYRNTDNLLFKFSLTPRPPTQHQFLI